MGIRGTSRYCPESIKASNEFPPKRDAFWPNSRRCMPDAGIGTSWSTSSRASALHTHRRTTTYLYLCPTQPLATFVLVFRCWRINMSSRPRRKARKQPQIGKFGLDSPISGQAPRAQFEFCCISLELRPFFSFANLTSLFLPTSSYLLFFHLGLRTSKDANIFYYATLTLFSPTFIALFLVLLLVLLHTPQRLVRRCPTPVILNLPSI